MFYLLDKHVRVDLDINLALVHRLLELEPALVQVHYSVRVLVERLSQPLQLQLENVVLHLGIHGSVYTLHTVHGIHYTQYIVCKEYRK